jgi:hypothetical protein
MPATMKRTKTATAADIQAETVRSALGLKTELLKKGTGPGSPEYAVAERLLLAAKSLPAYELAVQAVADVGEEGLPAAVIRRLTAARDSA